MDFSTLIGANSSADPFLLSFLSYVIIAVIYFTVIAESTLVFMWKEDALRVRGGKHTTKSDRCTERSEVERLEYHTPCGYLQPLDLPNNEFQPLTIWHPWKYAYLLVIWLNTGK